MAANFLKLCGNRMLLSSIFEIIYKDTSPAPTWYKTNCTIKRDVLQHRSGLLLGHTTQEIAFSADLAHAMLKAQS
jgi:hypothetical protein